MAAWPYSTSQWKRLRLNVLTDEPLCRYCREIGKLTPAEHVDHIQSVRSHPELAFELSNLQPLCESCHNGIKKIEEARGYRIGSNMDGQPLDPGHHWNK